MRKSFGLIATAALAFTSIGAAPPPVAPPPVAPPPAGGTISIDPRPDDGYDVAMPAFEEAASKALTARGFTVFEDQGHAASVVELLLSRSTVGTGLTRVPGQRGASIAGAGVAVPLGTGASDVVRLQRTRLEMRIRRRGNPAIVWDGTAVTVREAGVRNGTDAAVAADLCRALLDVYPAQPRDIVGVP